MMGKMKIKDKSKKVYGSKEIAKSIKDTQVLLLKLAKTCVSLDERITELENRWRTGTTKSDMALKLGPDPTQRTHEELDKG